jgi:hypothetical protein
VACDGCGARSVGEPLPRPENELPAYGRSLLLSVIGTLAVLVFAVETIIALVGRATLSFGFWSWVAAGETASWRLKWAAIPLTLVVLFGSRRIYRSIRQSPGGFCGLRAARNGYLASAAVPLLILILIGVTVPARLRHRQWGIEAADNAQGYATARVLLQYREKFGTFPADKKDLAQLPDPDGSIAVLIKDLEGAEYKPSAEVAAVPTQRPRMLRGAVIRNASLTSNVDESLTEALSVTNYEMRLPGADKLLNTDDDLIIRDGLVGKASETPRRGNVGKSATAQKTR